VIVALLVAELADRLAVAIVALHGTTQLLAR